MPGKQSLEFLKQVAAYMSKSNSFDRVLQKLKIVDGGCGRCVGELTVSKEHLNNNGTLHTGLTATIIDNITTYALMSKPAHPGVSVALQLSNMDESKEGDELIFDAHTVRTGKTLAYVECEIRRKTDGCIIAKGKQTKFIDFD